MTALFKGTAKYMLLLPVTVLILSTFYYMYASEHVADVIRDEKCVEVIKKVNIIKSAVEADDGRNWEEYEPNVVACAQFIDSMNDVFSCAYRSANGGWELIYDCLSSPEIRPLMMEILVTAEGRESGSFTINCPPEVSPSRDLRIYFSQMPLNAPPEERYLVIAGVSKISFVPAIPAWVNAGQWVSIIMTLGLNVGLLILITRMQRNKTKG
jgi:hypothetical protein